MILNSMIRFYGMTVYVNKTVTKVNEKSMKLQKKYKNITRFMWSIPCISGLEVWHQSQHDILLSYCFQWRCVQDNHHQQQHHYHIMVQKRSIQKCKTLSETVILGMNPKLTSSTCNCPPTLYFQKHGFQDKVDNHSPALQRSQQNKRDQSKHPEHNIWLGSENMFD